MQKGDALHCFSLAAAMGRGRRTVRLMPGGLMPVGLRSGIITTATAVSARPFRPRSTFICAPSMRARRGTRAPVLGGRGSCLAMTRRAAILARQRDADQLFDVAQIAHFLGACDQRDRNALGAGARGAAD